MPISDTRQTVVSRCAMPLKWRQPPWARFYNHNGHYAALVFRQGTSTATSALDVGCGDGRYTVQLPDLGFSRVVGIDPAPDQTAPPSCIGSMAGGWQCTMVRLTRDTASSRAPVAHDPMLLARCWVPI